MATISELTNARSAEWLSALLDSDDIRARAAGLMLQGKVAGDPLASQVMTEEARDSLVQLALGTDDPAVYAVAVYACHTYGTPVTAGACPQLSLRAWAHMDVNNAVPWLLLAQQARVRGDDAAAADAFAQAAKAQKVDSYNFSLFAFADPEQPSGTTPLERWTFALQVSGIEAALQPTYASAASKYCSEEAVQDGTIRQQCGAVAQLFVEKSTTLLDFAMGTSLGKKAGWPTARTDALNEEKFGMMEALTETGPAEGDTWSCDAVARGNAFWHQRLKLGELAAARDAIAQTGESPKELTRKFEDRMAKYAENASTRD
jgi:hypothetical protein